MHIKIPVYIYAAKQVYGRSLRYYKSVTKEQVFICGKFYLLLQTYRLCRCKQTNDFCHFCSFPATHIHSFKSQQARLLKKSVLVVVKISSTKTKYKYTNIVGMAQQCTENNCHLLCEKVGPIRSTHVQLVIQQNNCRTTKPVIIA